jgi:hypothetical protein
MTTQPGGAGPVYPVGVLQTLSFQPISDNGFAASYEALVESDQVPGSPVFAITVTFASSLQQQAGPALQTFFDGMKASFDVLSTPPDNGGPDDEELINIGTQMLIEISLVSYGGAGPVAVTVTVETTTGIVPFPEGIKQDLPHLVGAGLEDHWRANPYQSFTATVKPRSGTGTVRFPRQNVVAGRTYYPAGKDVFVAASSTGALDYSMSGDFVLVGHNVKSG